MTSDAPRVTSARPSAGQPAPKGQGTGKGSKARRNPPPVKQPKPWGSIALFTALAVFAVSVITFAVLNAGSGRLDPDEITVEGVETFEDLDNSHTEEPVTYDQAPPVGGNHNPTPQDCQGRVYDAPVRSEHAVHSLEHGAVWVTYKPGLAEGQVADLAAKVQGENYRMMSPFADQESPIVLSGWGVQLEVDSADDERVDLFLKKYTAGEQTQEPGASCAGVVTTEG